MERFNRTLNLSVVTDRWCSYSERWCLTIHHKTENTHHLAVKLVFSTLEIGYYYTLRMQMFYNLPDLLSIRFHHFPYYITLELYPLFSVLQTDQNFMIFFFAGTIRKRFLICCEREPFFSNVMLI